MKRLQERLRLAMAGRTRGQVAAAAEAIAYRAWGDEMPLIDESTVRDLDSRLETPPADGRVLRCVLAAVGVPMVEALEILGYWPDVGLVGRSRPLTARLAEALRVAGFPDAAVIGVAGRQVTIQLGVHPPG
jgi:hypothetical protein